MHPLLKQRQCLLVPRIMSAFVALVSLRLILLHMQKAAFSTLPFACGVVSYDLVVIQPDVMRHTGNVELLVVLYSS